MPESENGSALPVRAKEDTPGTPPKRLALTELLAGMTPDRQHKAENDQPRGAELI